jgi:hypothetical protein
MSDISFEVRHENMIFEDEKIGQSLVSLTEVNSSSVWKNWIKLEGQSSEILVGTNCLFAEACIHILFNYSFTQI